MKRTLFAVAILAVISLALAGSTAFAQQGSQIKVKGSDVVTGVVVVDILKDGKPYDLQCNQGAGNCKSLKNGTYWMVELPPNYGLYDCRNVEVYRINGEVPSSERIGEYCLIAR